MAVNILYPWKMIGRFEDNKEITVGGFDEEDCMYKLCKLQKSHGNMTWYGGFSDENYEAGEYIGKENFIYE